MFRHLSPFLLCCSGFLSAGAQDCNTIDHVTRQFDVNAEYDVLYGTAVRFDGGTDSLWMNIHKPIGDGSTERPLLVAIHGGAFISGDRSEMDELCRWYAERGYVAATVSYRLGFHGMGLLAPPFAYDAAEVIRSAYRAQQDVKGAIRFLRSRQAEDSTSTDNVFVCGVSAGGIAALHATYATGTDERPPSCGAIEAVNHILNVYPRPDLGPIEGDLNPGPSSSVKACVSYFGAVLDTALIGSVEDPALFTYHQTGDPVVGCGHQQALWGMPLGVGANYPWLFGSCAIDPHMQQLGFGADRYEFHPHVGTGHSIHDIELVDGWAAQFLAGQFCGTTSIVTEDLTGTDVTVHPNPAQDRITVRSGDPVLGLRLMDLRGSLVAEGTGSTLDVRALTEGLYLLRVTTQASNGTVRVRIAH